MYLHFLSFRETEMAQVVTIISPSRWLSVYCVQSWLLVMWRRKEHLISHIEAETRWSSFRRRHFQVHFVEWNAWISITISLKFVPKGAINNIPSLVQIKAWRRPGDKPLSEPMMVRLPTHIWFTRPQWVKTKYQISKKAYVIYMMKDWIYFQHLLIWKRWWLCFLWIWIYLNCLVIGYKQCLHNTGTRKKYYSIILTVFAFVSWSILYFFWMYFSSCYRLYFVKL